jgi:ABC-type polysaccharide/polyol phosphate transport system ATPase subunit
LIVDEVLGVGDAAFQRKCVEAVRKLMEQGTALLCVSHIAGVGQEFCSRAIWLSAGEVLADGEYRDTINKYREFSNSGGSKNDQHVLAHPAAGDL